MIKIFLIIVVFFTILSAETNYELYKKSMQEKEYKTAKIYLLKALNESFENDNIDVIQSRYYDIASLYTKTKEYYKAIEYYKLSLKLESAKKTKTAENLIKIYKNLSYCYGKIGNNFKTFKYSYKASKIASKNFGKNSRITKKLTKDVAQIQSKLISSSI